MIYCIEKDIWFCPQCLSSNHCEQAFCFCRIGRYKGRQSNISGSDLTEGLAKRNRSVEIDSMVNVLEPQPIAHSRSLSMMDYPKTKTSSFFNNKAKSVEDITNVVKIMNVATSYAAHVASQLSGVFIEDGFVSKDLDSTSAKHAIEKCNLNIGNERLLKKLNKVYGADHMGSTEVHGVTMEIKSCMAIFGNRGRTSLPSQSRASRFYWYVFEDITLNFPYPKTNSQHVIYEIGDKFADENGSGKVVGLFWKKSKLKD